MANCLGCKKSEVDCKCEGGFKVLYHFGVPKSHAEMKEFNKKSKVEQALALTGFMSNRTAHLEAKNSKALESIAENSIKIADAFANIKLPKKKKAKKKK